LAAERIDLVYGGAKVGLMGAIADAVLQAGGQVFGVLPEFLQQKEVAHEGLTELVIVQSMHERKAKMAELSDAFVALPGGAGTLEELFEVWTWGQLGLHAKPCGILDVNGFYGHLTSLIEHMTAEGFLRPEHHAMMQIDHDPKALLQKLRSYQPPRQKWTIPKEPLDAVS
jgi:uncharacterized protein (TIGR00730 family)